MFGSLDNGETQKAAMFYVTEYEDDDSKIRTQQFGCDLAKARRRARYLSRKDHSLMVYVVACTHEDRVGAEAFAYGRRDHVEGKIV